MHRFKKLAIWRRSCRFATIMYSLAGKFPNSERFGLTNQLRRASVSIPSNIAEGTSRSSKKEFRRFLEFALGSCYEIETQLSISNDLGFFSKDHQNGTQKELEEIIKMISKFKSGLI